MRQVGYVIGALCWSCLLGLCMLLPLAGCPSIYWTHPTKPPTAFADDAMVCEGEAMQTMAISDVFDPDHYNAYLTCLRGKGWELQQRP